MSNKSNTPFPMVRITWHDAKDTETGWVDIKDIVSSPTELVADTPVGTNRFPPITFTVELKVAAILPILL